MNKTISFVAAALGLSAAQAHVTLEAPKSPAGAPYKAVLQIGHACGEGTATQTVTVQVPAGFRGAKPMPKAGWQISIKRAPLAQPYESRGRKVSEDVVEISWKASSREAALPDAQYDEFVLHGQAPDQPGPIWFKLQQLCDKGQWDWSETPTGGGTSTKGLTAPALLLEVQPNEHAGHQH